MRTSLSGFGAILTSQFLDITVRQGVKKARSRYYLGILVTFLFALPKLGEADPYQSKTSTVSRISVPPAPSNQYFEHTESQDYLYTQPAKSALRKANLLSIQLLGYAQKKLRQSSSLLTEEHDHISTEFKPVVRGGCCSKDNTYQINDKPGTELRGQPNSSQQPVPPPATNQNTLQDENREPPEPGNSDDADQLLEWWLFVRTVSDWLLKDYFERNNVKERLYRLMTTLLVFQPTATFSQFLEYLSQLHDNRDILSTHTIHVPALAFEDNDGNQQLIEKIIDESSQENQYVVSLLLNDIKFEADQQTELLKALKKENVFQLIKNHFYTIEHLSLLDSTWKKLLQVAQNQAIIEQTVITAAKQGKLVSPHEPNPIFHLENNTGTLHSSSCFVLSFSQLISVNMLEEDQSRVIRIIKQAYKPLKLSWTKHLYEPFHKHHILSALDDLFQRVPKKLHECLNNALHNVTGADIWWDDGIKIGSAKDVHKLYDKLNNNAGLGYTVIQVFFFNIPSHYYLQPLDQLFSSSSLKDNKITLNREQLNSIGTLRGNKLTSFIKHLTKQNNSSPEILTPTIDINDLIQYISKMIISNDISFSVFIDDLLLILEYLDNQQYHYELNILLKTIQEVTGENTDQSNYKALLHSYIRRKHNDKVLTRLKIAQFRGNFPKLNKTSLVQKSPFQQVLYQALARLSVGDMHFLVYQWGRYYLGTRHNKLSYKSSRSSTGYSSGSDTDISNPPSNNPLPAPLRHAFHNTEVYRPLDKNTDKAYPYSSRKYTANLDRADSDRTFNTPRRRTGIAFSAASPSRYSYLSTQHRSRKASQYIPGAITSLPPNRAIPREEYLVQSMKSLEISYQSQIVQSYPHLHLPPAQAYEDVLHSNLDVRRHWSDISKTRPQTSPGSEPHKQTKVSFKDQPVPKLPDDLHFDDPPSLSDSTNPESGEP